MSFLNRHRIRLSFLKTISGIVSKDKPKESEMQIILDLVTTLQQKNVLFLPVGRKLSDARFNVDSDQAFRSDMNWNERDTLLLEHFRKLGKIRYAHPAIGKGCKTTIDTHTCFREYGGNGRAEFPDYSNGVTVIVEAE